MKSDSLDLQKKRSKKSTLVFVMGDVPLLQNDIHKQLIEINGHRVCGHLII